MAIINDYAHKIKLLPSWLAFENVPLLRLFQAFST